jgi:hypothetical protein
MKQLENIAVKIDGREQWEQVAAVLEGYGIKKCTDRIFNDWDCRLRIERVNKHALTLKDGINLWGDDVPTDKTIYTFTDFMQKFSNSQPDPIAELTKRLEALEAWVVGNTGLTQPAPEPKPETVYDGVFWFEGNGKASCIKGKQVMSYSESDDTWLIYSSEDLPKHLHRLVPVDKFTVGKWYACEGADLNTPFGYSMYLGVFAFVTWNNDNDYPIWIHDQSDNERVQLLEVQPA